MLLCNRHEKELPASLDLFGWCTWDAYYFRVSAKGIREGLQSFKQGGVQPRFLVIDDGKPLDTEATCTVASKGRGSPFGVSICLRKVNRTLDLLRGSPTL